MKLSWNLTELFSSKEQMEEAILVVHHLLKELGETKLPKTAEELLNLLKLEWNTRELADKILRYGSFCYYKNVKSETCIALKQQVEELDSGCKHQNDSLLKRILSLGQEQINAWIYEDPKLAIYEPYLEHLFQKQDHITQETDSEMVRNNTNQIHQALTTYNELLHNMEYESILIDGEAHELTSSNFARYLSSRDRDTRKQAYQNVNQAFLEKQDAYASLLDSIYEKRIQNARFKQYHSVLEQALIEEQVDPRVVTTLIDAVHNQLPLMQQYLQLKAQILKIKDPHLYDFGVPLDQNLKQTYSLEEAITIIKQALQPLGETYLKMIDTLLDGHVDALADSKKHQSITFSWNTYSFLNFRGSYLDLKNLAHELGHIVHYSFSEQQQPFLYQDSTVFVGEVASIVNEILLNHYLFHQASTQEEKCFYLSKEIENYVTSVFKQTLYTEFEQRLYQEREKHSLTAPFLSEQYASLLKHYYGKQVYYDEVSKIEWTRLGHLYRWSYYPYKYATGLLMASCVVQSLIYEQTLTKEAYLSFLSSGSSEDSMELLRKLQVDLTQTETISCGFQVLGKDLQELEKVLKLL